MRASQQLAVAAAALICQLLLAFADDAITNAMSPVASYQYLDATGTDANSDPASAVASYQYFDFAASASLSLQSSLLASYYYPPFDALPFNIILTSRVPTTAETTPAYSFAPPPPAQLEFFAAGSFTANPPFPLDKSRMTVVLTHGWNSDPTGWATAMAALMVAKLGTAAPNIVAWDWRDTAKATFPGTPAAQTYGQGTTLGQALANALGPNYSKPIHFIGHSLGTLVNANAADYLHGNGFAWTNTQMTLFDEAEAATDISSLSATIETLIGLNENPLSPKFYYYHPLPKQFRCADNYVAAFGLLHPEAANVILTNHFPANAPTVSGWIDALTAFHGYPMPWYDRTIQSDVSPLGFLWSFERGGQFSQAPPTNSVYVQAGSEWNLTPTNWTAGTNLLATRFAAYQSKLVSAAGQVVNNTVSAHGSAFGLTLFDSLSGSPTWVVGIGTGIFESATPQFKVQSFGQTTENASGSNTPAYAWMQLAVPANAVAMSFDFKIQGDWQSDSLAAAFNGTNVLLVAGDSMPTNTTLNSGLIDVSAFAGQTNEFFIGIIGGTSTNAQLAVENLVFYVVPPPMLQAQNSGGSVVVTWPLAAAGYALETTADLATTNSWAVVTNVPAVFNFQSTVTNDVSGASRFYRLKAH